MYLGVRRVEPRDEHPVNSVIRLHFLIIFAIINYKLIYAAYFIKTLFCDTEQKVGPLDVPFVSTI